MRTKKLLPLRLITGFAFTVYLFTLISGDLQDICGAVSALGALAVMVAVFTDRPRLMSLGAALALASPIRSILRLGSLMQTDSRVMAWYLLLCVPQLLTWIAVLAAGLKRKWLSVCGITVIVISAVMLLRGLLNLNAGASGSMTATVLRYGARILLGALLVADGGFNDPKTDSETKEPTPQALSDAAAAAVCAGLSDGEKEKQLAQLKSFLDSGLITKEEYEERKKALK